MPITLRHHVKCLPTRSYFIINAYIGHVFAEEETEKRSPFAQGGVYRQAMDPGLLSPVLYCPLLASRPQDAFTRGTRPQ